MGLIPQIFSDTLKFGSTLYPPAIQQFAREAMDHLVVSMVPIPFANLGVEDSTVIHIIINLWGEGDFCLTS